MAVFEVLKQGGGEHCSVYSEYGHLHTPAGEEDTHDSI